MLDVLLGILALAVTVIMMLSVCLMIQGLIFRLICSSTNNQNTYRIHQRALDYLFDGISLLVVLIFSYYFGVCFLAPIYVTISGYTPEDIAIGTTAAMFVLFVLLIWKSRPLRHKALEQDYSKA